MDTELCAEIDKMVEVLRLDLYQKAHDWSKVRTPSGLFDFEQELQRTLNSLQKNIVGAVLEAIHRDASFVAECQKQAHVHCRVPRYGYRSVSVQTLSGYQVKVRTPYSLHRHKVRKDQRRTNKNGRGVGLYPVLRRLGIVHGNTPRFLAEVTRQFVDGPSLAEASERLANREIDHSASSIRRLTQAFATLALSQRQQLIDNLDKVKPLRPLPLAGKRVVVGLDGGRIRIRVNKRTYDQTKTRDYTGDDCEPKLFVIYTIDQAGNKMDTSEVVYDGTILSSEQLFELLEFRLRQMGISKAELLVIIGDGAPWIWNGAAKLRSDLPLKNIRVFEIVDFVHSVSKLTIPAKLTAKRHFQQRDWFRQMRNLLKKGKVDKVIAKLLELDHSQDLNQDIRKAIEYFQTHQTRMQYAEFQAEGLPIGSGVIESGVRRIVNLRMKGASLFWSPENAEGILYLRCQIKGGQWQTFFKSVLSEWATNMTISFAQTDLIRNEISTRFLETHPPVFVDNSHDNAIKWARDLLEASKAIIIDTETTGLDRDDEILQLAVIDLQGNVLLETLVRSAKPIAPEASAVHGITAQCVASSPTFAELYEKIAGLISERDLVAYNADFDRRMMLQTCKNHGLPEFEFAEWHCAMKKYGHFWGERYDNGNFRQHSLTNACIQQDIAIHGTHQATKDCLLTLELIKVMAATDTRERAGLRQRLS
jgi:DNA polymerase III epsilon subunit-like protein